MRNTSKMTTLENRFPLLAVEHGCIISKDADITVAFEVELPELYTVTGAEYEAIHSCWCKAIKVLPDYSVVHKQDWFIKERYKPELQKDDMSFLSRSFERHFNERPYLKHTCYLYLTKTTKERKTGLIERYFSLMPEGDTTLQDIELSAREMRIGDNRLCLHTLSDAEDLPGKVATDTRYEKLSTDRSDCRLSFASPVGLLLSCNHIYNQYVLIDNSEETLQKFEKSARNMQSLSRYSRSNSINREWIDQYLNEAHSYGLTSVRAHFNVMAWSDDAEELKHIKNDVGSQLASMECVPRHNTIDCPTLYWAAIPGNAADFPAEESFHTFIEQAVCLFTEETNYRSSLSPFGIKMVDRLTGKPLHHSYQGLCGMIRRKTGGADGVYFTYTEDKPISFNPFYTDDYIFDVEKKDSIKTLLLTLWKSEDDKVTKTESGELGSAVSAYIERIQSDRSIVPSFNTFYEYMRDDYRKELAQRDIKVEKSDFNIDNMLTTMRQYYRGGRYDEYLRYMYKTVRKYYGEAIVVTQEVDDIISSPVVKESIINNSDCKILLDQRKYMNKFDQIQALLGLTEKEKSQILSINMANNPSRLYKEVWIGLGGTQSAVYATEVSAEEYLAYTTEETEKVEVYRLAEKLGDDIEAAIRQLAERRRNKE